MGNARKASDAPELTRQQATKINWDRLSRWSQLLSADVATAQVLFGVVHAGPNRGIPVIVRTQDGPSDRELYLLCRAALETWAQSIK
jgi:hypothetical protein